MWQLQRRGEVTGSGLLLWSKGDRNSVTTIVGDMPPSLGSLYPPRKFTEQGAPRKFESLNNGQYFKYGQPEKAFLNKKFWALQI